MRLQTNTLVKMPDEEYFAIDRVSSSSVRTFKRNRREYYLQYVSKELPDKDSPALRIGSAVHAWALEGIEAYEERFTVGPDCDIRSIKWREFCEAVPQGITVLHPKREARLVRYMVDRLWNNHRFRSTMEEINPEMEQAAFFDYQGWECKAKLDAFGQREDGTYVLVDLKTCGDSSPPGFQESADKWHYIDQLAFYVEALRACGIEGKIETWFATVDKKFPVAAAMYEIKDHQIYLGSLENKHNLNEIRKCYDTGDWSCEHELAVNRIEYR